MIILERDGSLHHYPPDRNGAVSRQARIDLHEEQTQPTVLERILDFTFDFLGFNSLEMRIHEQPKR